MIETARLRLAPATVALARAEVSDRGEFARLLGAAIPESWPPESLAEALPIFLSGLEAAPGREGWFSWYALVADVGGGAPVLVATGGFTGPPEGGAAEIGYAVLPEFQGRGYASEMVGALVQWAFEHPEVARIVARTEWANPASVRVLIKAGFARMESSGETEGALFEILRGG